MNCEKYDTNMLVSIIMPAHNSCGFIKESIASVQQQTYKNWELLIVDDCSSDNTFQIIEDIQNEDSRIKLFRLTKNLGATGARNYALDKANGRFIAYLDSDDIWMPCKLERQVAFMTANNYAFSCVDYEIISEEGEQLNKVIHMRSSVSYNGYLEYNLLQTVGIMVDIHKVDKKHLVMPDIFRPEDAATRLQILKIGVSCYGINETLAQYRRVGGSLSANKVKGASGMWRLYRDIEKLPFFYSCYCYIRYAVLAIWKRIYPNHRKGQ